MKGLVAEVRELCYKAHASASAERALVKRVPELCDALEKSQRETELITKMYAKACEDKCILHSALEQAKAYIKTIENESRWIPITERLPQKGDRVLGLFTFRFDGNEIWENVAIENEYLGDGNWLSDGDYITHWTTLPELPKE